MITQNTEKTRIYTSLRLLLSIHLVLFSTACSVWPSIDLKNPGRPDANNTIYLSLTAEKESQIWSYSRENSMVTEIFAVPRHTSIHSLDRRELAFLETFCSSLSVECHVEDLKVDYAIHQVSLSPNKRYLTWLESESACIGMACFGQTNLFAWNTNGKSEPEILISQPYHIDMSDTLIFEAYTWSPDSQNISYVVSSYVHGWVQIQALEVATKKAINIGEAIRPDVRWSPKGDYIAYITVGTNGVTVSITSLSNLSISTYSGQWLDITDFTWSPDGHWILVNGQRNQFALYRLRLTLDGQLKEEKEVFTEGTRCRSTLWSSSADRIACLTSKESPERTDRILLVNSTTGSPTDISNVISEGAQFINPQWSPDGKVMAVLALTNGLRNDQTLLIFDTERNQTSASLAGNDFSPVWKWDTGGDSILLLKGNPAKPCVESKQSIGIFHWSEATFRELPLGNMLEQALKQCKLHIDSIDW